MILDMAVWVAFHFAVETMWFIWGFQCLLSLKEAEKAVFLALTQRLRGDTKIPFVFLPYGQE